MYTITLNDGTRLENLTLNGNNYISETLLDDSIFQGNLDTVTVSHGETEEVFTDMRLMSNRVDGGKSWFVLGEKSKQQQKEEETARKLAQMEQAMTALLTGEV